MPTQLTREEQGGWPAPAKPDVQTPPEHLYCTGGTQPVQVLIHLADGQVRAGGVQLPLPAPLL